MTVTKPASQKLILGACLFVVVSASKASDVGSNVRDAGPVNAPTISALCPEEALQAVQRDLQLAVQNHEALAESLRGQTRMGSFAPSIPEAISGQASRVDVQGVRETLLSINNAQVQAWESHFSGTGLTRLRAALLRLGPERALLENVLRRRGLPPELISIAFVESEFVPNAVSPKGATGLWQIMPVTAWRYGLKLKPFQDDRTDLEKSTSAAARYLTSLYERFGDWPLALAAYNTGKDRVADAVAKGNTRDFWTLSRLRLLPEETRNYVPKVLGALRVWKGIIASNPETGVPGAEETVPSEHDTWVYTTTSGNYTERHN